MKKIRPFLIVWVSGVIAGVVMVERWRRTGAIESAASNAEDATGAAGPATQVPAETPVAAAIIVGAKADAEKVWGALAGLTSRRPSAASLTKWRPSAPSSAPASAPAEPA